MDTPTVCAQDSHRLAGLSDNPASPIRREVLVCVQ